MQEQFMSGVEFPSLPPKLNCLAPSLPLSLSRVTRPAY